MLITSLNLNHVSFIPMSPPRSRVERLLCQDIVIGFDKSIVFSYSSP